MEVHFVVAERQSLASYAPHSESQKERYLYAAH